MFYTRKWLTPRQSDQKPSSPLIYRVPCAASCNQRPSFPYAGNPERKYLGTYINRPALPHEKFLYLGFVPHLRSVSLLPQCFFFFFTMRPIGLLFSFSSLAGLVAGQIDSNTTYLTATALVTKNNNSALECWQLTEPFRRSSVPGVSGTQVATISNNSNFAYTILPPRFDGGIHTAPVPQYALPIFFS